MPPGDPPVSAALASGGAAHERETASGIHPAIGAFVRLVCATRDDDRDEIVECRARLRSLGWIVTPRSDATNPADDGPPAVSLDAAMSQSIRPIAGNRRGRRARREKAPANERVFWSIDDIADQAGVSRRHIERLRSEGRFLSPDSRLGRRLLVSRARVLQFLQEGGIA
jgi:hypothetical protein